MIWIIVFALGRFAYRRFVRCCRRCDRCHCRRRCGRLICYATVLMRIAAGTLRWCFRWHCIDCRYCIRIAYMIIVVVAVVCDWFTGSAGDAIWIATTCVVIIVVVYDAVRGGMMQFICMFATGSEWCVWLVDRCKWIWFRWLGTVGRGVSLCEHDLNRKVK